MFQIGGVFGAALVDTARLRSAPEDFVGVELGAVPGQDVHLDRLVDVVSVDDQMDLTAQMADQTVQKRDDHSVGRPFLGAYGAPRCSAHPSESAKDHFELDHSQVRLYTALARHIVLTMAALAVCAVTAAQAKTRAPAPTLPATPDDQPPEDPGLIALTVAEIKRLFALVTRRFQPETHKLHWIWWRCRHQARARWFHHRARLRRQITTT